MDKSMSKKEKSLKAIGFKGFLVAGGRLELSTPRV